MKKRRKKWALFVLAIIVLAGVVFVIANNRADHNKRIATHIPSKGPAKNSGQKKSAKATANPSKPSDQTSDKSPSFSGSLVMPSGNFVSNHRPSLSGSPLLRQEKSVCNTTPGATCYILFMKDGVAKQLDPQTVDSTGSTYWIWDVSQAGFTQGSWKITAVASLNGQTVSADDSLELEVQP